MSTDTPPQGSLVPVEPPPQRAATGSGLVHALWGLSGVLIGVVLGAAGVGDNLMRYLQGDVRQAREVHELSDRLGELRNDLTARERQLAAERQERKEAVGALKETLEASEWKALAATLKGDFLGRFLGYEQGRSDGQKFDGARRQLIDAVCGLRSQSKSARMTVVSAPWDLSSADVRGGANAAVDQVLAEQGVSPDLLARARRLPANVPMPAVTAFNVFEVQRAAQARRLAMRDVNEAVAAVQRHVQNIKLAKAVRFSDGTEYAIPQEVALSMLSRKDCQSD